MTTDSGRGGQMIEYIQGKLPLLRMSHISRSFSGGI
jgi:hypothetical protein